MALCLLVAIINTGKAAICKTTEKMISIGNDFIYKKPMATFPKKEAMPKAVSKVPNAVLLLSLEVALANIAFRRDSCAPNPMPHKIIPTKIKKNLPRKTKSAKNAPREKATSIIFGPILSNNLPKIRELIPATAIATA